MTIEMANTVLLVMLGYLGIGLGVGLVFTVFFIGRLDVSARNSSFLFRLLILPGIAMLWPAIVMRIISLRTINKPIDEASS